MPISVIIITGLVFSCKHERTFIMGIYSYKIKAGTRYRYTFDYNNATYTKTGYKTSKEAKAAEAIERNRVESFGTTDITFNNLVEEYLKDSLLQMKKHSHNTKATIIKNHITGVFPNEPIKNIKPLHVRKWQNQMKKKKNSKGEPFKDTYLKTIQNQLSAIFNYAVSFYDLPKNPVPIAGPLGKKHRDGFEFWTLDEFITFLNVVDDKLAYTVIHVLFFTGLRIGELIALTWADIDLANGNIDVNKTRQLVDGKWQIFPPKSPKSKRIVTIDKHTVQVLSDWKRLQYDTKNKTLVFPTDKSRIARFINKYSIEAEVKKIRVHDLRHSHASYLIELGTNIIEVSERLGHEKVQTTIDTYIHLYPNKQREIANSIDENLTIILQRQEKKEHIPL